MAMGRATPILQIVGYQNSGKTTLMEKLVHAFSSEGRKVATIKHHGHGGFPELSQKDSERHRQAGAVVSAVEGAGLLSLSALRNHWMLKDVIQLYEFFAVDLILIEGYKTESYPKIVLLRSLDDMSLLEQVDNIKAVIVWDEAIVQLQKTYKIFHITDADSYMKWLVEMVRGAK
ncbi:molybdopterin-guanine dinucleotide biosynthesis protein B [Bacillus cytotoxicus]|uniref:molybdopterin-guanine dinucleotide biosynthesis protein B n=1 Tax=Bacillus cytotoxicus TaxID=580165 RepID=UPI00065FDD03|nr:molybdopterin-guanine dinucleotide biosynthesis protein B [Bacillus cytotoxicus]AWC30194.1 molybdopterin-guanine dinucleotide biosynthesis protein MobB [Bacillus cytotoxicus]AWC34251.1 molybdopterin-guanine dinucleotide biosynthesis protein MobB [Bacillus cytotoxicus]AWC38250.1 molybdopterin-guanine dinucleotide biosynthesis protein MobB [Bacillus cytotoxicus]AWC42331.1 molybdopterin-guanine dinucleotide biosynthesis protein MobB [Bacillus cytotoxicus]AWC46221.1 molybdopterin-guanine dinucl